MFILSQESHKQMMESEARRVRQQVIEKKEAEAFNKYKSKIFKEVKEDPSNIELKPLKRNES